ncbi:hypothetical protein CARUB_v10024543mg [Capsella rubella]|uniref:F-box domain-containing protein n=1 Tax=Capsella rubella TaxID=81985 RepID=R0FZ28_9BRAS|nr:hypothetical protein CARUB_v10024543mg [Capsella rubella]
MEKQEEEEEKRKGLCPSSKETSLSLPLDLICEVLIRLPARGIGRSRCVSKLWLSYTTLASFNNLFTARFSQSPCVLAFKIRGDNLLAFSLPQQGNSDNCSPVDSYVIKCPKNCEYSHYMSSAHGVYCFHGDGKLGIWNPTTRQFSTLTKPESCWEYTLGFVGYDPIDGTYKVVCMPEVYSSTYPEPRNQARVLTLGRGQKSSWRFIQGSFEHFPRLGGRCIKGVLYYEAHLSSDLTHRIVMSFHVKSEKFKMIQVPWSQSEGILLAYQGKLALAWQASEFSFDPFISLWVLEDAERHEWSFKRLSLPFPLEDPILETSLFLKGVTSAGEFVYASSSWSVSFDPFHALYFDPKRNTVRRVIYQGLAEPEFRRDGLGKIVTMFMFPDHIESLLSV